MDALEKDLGKLDIANNTTTATTTSEPTTTTNTEEPSYRIPFHNTEAWHSHLKQQGFVVVANCITTNEVESATNHFWDWLGSLGSGVDRNDATTWVNSNWPGAARLGFMQSHGGGQCEAAWELRGNPNIKSCFSTIWDNETDLLTSMDTFIAWRPWWWWEAKQASDGKGENWFPRVENLHVDQSPVRRRGFHCVQGMVVLVDVDPAVGGLQVVPNTHTDEVQEYLRQNYGRSGDWCELRSSDKYIGTGLLLLAKAGDLILWDSRTIHGGHVGDGKPTYASSRKTQGEQKFARLALTVCMTPKHKASNEVLQQRVRAFEQGWTLTHWPHEFVPHGFGSSGATNVPKDWKYVAPKLSEEQRALLA